MLYTLPRGPVYLVSEVPVYLVGEVPVYNPGMARAAVLLAEGFEEIEAITVIDVLRRGDVEVVALGVTGTTVRGNHGIAVQADAALASGARERWDLVVLPGGMPGASTLRDDPRVQAMLRAQRDEGVPLAAICAAPIALGKAGLLHGKRATCFPGFEAQLTGATVVTETVVDDGDVITSRGPGTALPFALALVARLQGREKATKLATQMLVSV